MAPPADEVVVLHRDADLLVLYKPPRLPTTRPDAGPCLVARAHALDPEAPRLHPSSRLDAEVSGLVTFARTRRANQALLAARRDGSYVRAYVGLSERSPRAPEGRWTAAIGLDPDDPRKRVAVVGDGAGEERGAPLRGARQAETRYRVLAQREHASLLALWPETGRTHQLRVHAAHAGAPLLGDRAYGGAQRFTLSDGRVLRAARVMLHCACVRLPAIGRSPGREVRAPIPEDMVALWVALGGDAALLAEAGSCA